MKNTKKTIFICLGLILAAVILVMFVVFLPKAKRGSEIAELLKPIITAENQSMDMQLVLSVSGKETHMQSMMYLLKQEDKTYFVVEQNGHPFFITEDVLYMENGHAFLLYDAKLDAEVKHVDIQMFMQIANLYEILDITTTKSEEEEIYTIEVSGEDAKELLAHVIPEHFGEISEWKSLKIELAAQENKLHSISFVGGAVLNGKEMVIRMKIYNFKTLEAGEYVIPQEVLHAVQTVDKESLFCITRDLYRLLVAFADIGSQEVPEGMVTLSANCGMIQFKKNYDFSELHNGTADVENAAEIEHLPDMIALLCMEGEISCTEESDGYLYTLKLNKNTMEEITEMVIPDGIDQFIKLTKGNVEIRLKDNAICSIEIGIAGTVQSLFSKIPSQVGVEFIFD